MRIQKDGSRTIVNRLDVVKKYLVRLGGLSDREVGLLSVQDFVRAVEFINIQLTFSDGSEVAEMSQS